MTGHPRRQVLIVLSLSEVYCSLCKPLRSDRPSSLCSFCYATGVGILFLLGLL